MIHVADSLPAEAFLVRSGGALADRYEPEAKAAWTAGRAAAVKLSGEVSLKENRLDMEAKLASAQGGAVISADMATAADAEIDGTLEQPKLTVKAASSEVAAAFEKNLLALRQRKSEHLLQLSNKQVEGLLEVYDRIRSREAGQK